LTPHASSDSEARDATKLARIAEEHHLFCAKMSFTTNTNTFLKTCYISSEEVKDIIKFPTAASLFFEITALVFIWPIFYCYDLYNWSIGPLGLKRN
jgi:hypothetical protein